MFSSGPDPKKFGNILGVTCAFVSHERSVDIAGRERALMTAKDRIRNSDAHERLPTTGGNSLNNYTV
jgi:hypothetical protein